MLDAHKRAEIESRTPEVMATEAHKPFGWSHGWGHDNFVWWATVVEMLHRLEIPAGARVLDVGCGPGWSTVFLAEAGCKATGVDIVPANVEVARRRAERWGVDATFEVADAESLNLGREFDAALVMAALHHSRRQADFVAGVARHLRPGGWALFGEPSWLHRFSPHARRTTRDLGWVERGITVRALRRDCRRAGLGEFRRFRQGTAPYESGLRPFVAQLTRLIGAQVAVAPQAQIWMAARKG